MTSRCTFHIDTRLNQLVFHINSRFTQSRDPIRANNEIGLLLSLFVIETKLVTTTPLCRFSTLDLSIETVCSCLIELTQNSQLPTRNSFLHLLYRFIQLYFIHRSLNHEPQLLRQRCQVL